MEHFSRSNCLLLLLLPVIATFPIAFCAERFLGIMLHSLEECASEINESVQAELVRLQFRIALVEVCFVAVALSVGGSTKQWSCYVKDDLKRIFIELLYIIFPPA